MKKLITLFLGVLLLNAAFGKKNPEEKESIYFLLGNISDYLGRNMIYESDSLVDMFYPMEKELSQKLKELFIKDYPDIKINTEESGHQNLISQTLTKKVNSFFDFSTDNNTRVLVGEEYVPLKKGTLRTNIFENDDQKYAFLIGVYTRFGHKTGNSYTISLANSVNKYKLCQQLLGELGIEYESQSREGFPTSNMIHFVPNSKMKEYLSKLIYNKYQQ